MKLPQFTVRRLMFITAIFAVGSFIAREFWEGMPPRSVVLGIPARLERLKPGMGYSQVQELLGLEKHWLKGGIGAQCVLSVGDGWETLFVYRVRPTKRPRPKPGVGWTAMDYYQSHAMVQLWFDKDPTPKMDGGRKLWRLRLTRASFSIDGRTMAEMPDAR
jgi:hypothetical protein